MDSPTVRPVNCLSTVELINEHTESHITTVDSREKVMK